MKLQMQVTADEAESIRRTAKSQGISVSEYLRRMVHFGPLATRGSKPGERRKPKKTPAYAGELGC